MTPGHFFFLVAVFAFLTGCGGTEPDFPTDQSVEYRIVSVSDVSFAGRKRYSANIAAPGAVTFEQRAQTALKAAADIREARNADVVTVFLLISPALKGFPLAIADYAPDSLGWTGDRPLRNGTWEAEATNEVFSETMIKIAELWYQHKVKFQVDDGFGDKKTDEEAVKKYIAGVMNIDPGEVDLVPFIVKVTTTRKEYTPK